MSEINNNNGTIDNGKVEVKEKDHIQLENILKTERSCDPMVDIYETEDEYVLIADLPGVRKENIKLHIEDGSLSIFGKINYGEALRRKYLLNESYLANFYRKFKLSDSINTERVEASYENGQLFVKLPKQDYVKPRNISIK
ncbi:MAG TPA: Hsp20/alpha crystallin family protein [Ignavibacteriaceae bacterium]|nr:Hsp20/alpha crystallin family protein [Ignavibacteriaceae bacterium]